MKFNTIDFETYYDREYSLSKLTTEAYIKDPRFQVMCCVVWDHEGNFHELDGAMGISALRARFREIGLDKHPLLAHNTYFDGAILAWVFGIVPPLYLDTMCIANALIRHETGSAALYKVAEHLRMPPKGTAVHNMLGRTRASLTDYEYAEYIDYCKHDVALSANAFRMLAPDMPREQLLAIDRVIRMFTQPVLEVDIDLCRQEIERDERETNELVRYTGLDTDTLMSNAKFAKELEKYVPVPKKVSIRTGRMTEAFSKQDPEFIKLMHHPNPTVKMLVAARLKVKSTIERTRFVSFIEIAERNQGKLPIPLKYYGAHTGRLSGFDDINMQNLKKKSRLRNAIRAPKGHLIVAADQKQVECRINACWSGETEMVEAFRNGDDLYSDFASTLYGIEVNSKDYPDERFIGKTCILGLGFYMGADRLVGTLSTTKVPITADFAQECVRTYRERYVNIRANWYRADQMLKSMQQLGGEQWGPLRTARESILLPNGMSLHYPDLMLSADGEYLYRERVRANRVGGAGEWTKIYSGKLVENCVQAMAGAIIASQLVKLSLKWRVVMQEHDKIVFCVRESDLDSACADITRVMRTPPEWMPDLPLDIDLKYGATYGDC